jgi:ankyrin repeat protein
MGNREIIEFLRVRGVAVDIFAHGVALFGPAEAATWLLDHGADVHAKNYEDKTPLAVAMQGEHADVADLLRRRGGVE